MRKSSKAISLLLSGLMATSCFSMAAVSASAAAVDSEETGAIMTLEERIAAGHELVLFKFPTSVWGPSSSVKWSTKKHTVNVCCQFYAIYGNTKEVASRAWEAPSTNMMADAAGSDTFYFDITESEQIAGDGKMEPNAAYGILFSTKANAGNASLLQPNGDGYQTCDMYFNTKCLGDTYVVDEPPTVRENTQNSQKIDYYGHSTNGIGQPLKKLTTMCTYLDGVTPAPASDALEMANRLKDYLPNPLNEPYFTTAKVQAAMASLGTNAKDVYEMYMERFGEAYESGTQYEHVDGVEDQNPDGSLKDAYRYRYTPDNKYPDPELVAERLNYDPNGHQEPELIKINNVAINLGNANLAPDNALPVGTVPAGANYTAVTTWTPSANTFANGTSYTLTATFTPKAGYQFGDDVKCGLSGVGSGSTAQLTGSFKEYVDGNFVVKYTFKMPDAPLPPDPRPEGTFVVSGDSSDIFGAAWDHTNAANEMEWDEANGVFTKTFTVDKAYKTVLLKVVKDGTEFFGDENGDNVVFKLTGAGDFTVTLVPSTGKIEVTGATVGEVDFVYGTVYAVGNGEENYLNGASWDPGYIANEMTMIEDDLWEIKFEGVGEGFERQIKFALDGTWTYNFGASKDPEAPPTQIGVPNEAGWDSGNIFFDTEDDCDITVRLDLRNFDFKTKTGATYTILIEYAPEPTDDIIGDVNGDGAVTIEDATLIQRRGVELTEFDALQEKLADTNGDGRISILDVTAIQKYLAEKTDGIGNTGKKLSEI